LPTESGVIVAHLVVALRNGGYHIDSGFRAYDPLPEPDGGFAFGDETVVEVRNPVRILEQLFYDNDWVAEFAREVWCDHWVLNCDTGKIVLDNDWTERSLMKALAVEKVMK